MAKRILFALALIPALLFSSLFAMPVPTAHAAVAAGCGNSFLGLPAWYKYLDVGPQIDDAGATVPNGDPCAINGPRQDGKFHWEKAAGFIAVAIFEALLRIAALVAVVYVVYGGFRYITSQGEPEGAKSARDTILNALIGVVIAVAAASIVSFIMQQLTSPISTPNSGGTGTIEELRGRMT